MKRTALGSLIQDFYDHQFPEDCYMADFDESLFHVDGSLLLNPTLQYDLDLFGDVYRRRSMSYVGTFAEVFDKWYTRDEYVFMAIHVKKSEVDRVVAWLKEQDVVKEVPEI